MTPWRRIFLERKVLTAASAIEEIKQDLKSLDPIAELIEDAMGMPTIKPKLSKAVGLLEDIIRSKAELGHDYEEDYKILRMLQFKLNEKFS